MTTTDGGATTSHPDVVLTDGSRFVWVRTMVATPKPPDRIMLQGVDQTQRFKHIADMTAQELAAKLRPRLFQQGEEYLLDHDPIEMAEKVLSNYCPATDGHQPDAGTLTKLNAAGPPPQSVPEFINGTNDRVSYDHASVSWPAMTALYVSSGCSATLIGSHTASTAAHCITTPTLYYTPYRSDTAPTAAYGTYTGTAIVPSGWGGSDPQFDFAKVTFATGTFSSWGWVGTSFIGYGAEGTAVNSWGYSVDTNSELWLKPGHVTAGAWPSYNCLGQSALRHDLDVYNGDSGSGLLMAAPTPNMVGINVSQWAKGPGPNCPGAQAPYCYYTAKARGWDSTTYNFFTTGGDWP